MRVLVVEDDEGIAAGLQAHLGQLGWAVDVTDGVETAWTALLVEPFDLVLLDLGLRDGDGAEVLRRLRQAPAGRLPDAATPVLVMTARDQVAARIEAWTWVPTTMSPSPLTPMSWRRACARCAARSVGPRAAR